MTTNFWDSSWRTLKGRLFLFAQRNSALVPAGLRRRLGSLLSQAVTADVAAIEDWSRPLVCGPDRGPVRWPKHDFEYGAKQGVGRGGKAGAEIRCLLATGSLDAGGMDEVVAFLARGLPQFGLQVAVVQTPREGTRTQSRLAGILRSEGIEVTDLDKFSCANWISAWHPDVISVHGVPDWVLEAATACSVPTIETLHGMHNQFNAAEADVSRRRELLTGLVSVSEMVRQQYLAVDKDCAPESVVTIPNGVMELRGPRLSRGRARALMGLSDEYLFVSLARHCVQKNTYGMARAFSQVAEAAPEAHLLICGRTEDYAYAGQVAELKRRMRHGDRLHLREHAPRPDVILSAADGFVLDSFFEGWALASMEALVAGVPVVVSDVGGAREQLAGRPEWGVVVSNPLGDPLTVDWTSMTAARFDRQSNQDELVDAMVSLSRGLTYDLTRRRFTSDAADRFDGRLCLERHANVLKAAAGGKSIAL